jgi:putative ABC transport system permease protein
VSRLLTVKLRRDLRASWTRFALMVLALAATVSVFGATLFAWSTVGRETRDAYVSTEPASATIVLSKPVDASRLAAIAAQARTRTGVLDATARTQFDTPVEVNGQARDIPLQVFVAAPDDPMRMVKFDLNRAGAWPPAPGEILLGDDDSLAQLGAAVGDTVSLTPPGVDTPVRLRIAGTVYDPSLAPSPQEQRGHAYLSTASLAGAGQPSTMDQLKIQVAEPGQSQPSRDRAAITAVAGDLGTWLQSTQGVTVREIQVPTPYAHPHQWQADVLLLSLLAGAAAALVLAAILVATMLNNLFTQQIPQIGILKAIGARSGRVTRHYLTMTLLVAVAATALALYPAILIGRGRVESLLGLLGIQAASLTASGWAYAATIAVGLTLPLLAALPPLVKTGRTTVRAAIDHHGGAVVPSAASRALARLGRLRRLDRGLLMAARNTVRRPARFWLSTGLLACAGIVFVTGMSLRSGTQAVEDAKKQQRYWDVEVQLAAPARPDTVTGAARSVAGVARIEAWTRLPVGVAGPGQLPFTRTYPDQGHGSIAVNTVPADTPRRPPPLLEGRWLNPGETGAVVLNQIVRDRSVPDLGPGDTVWVFIDGTPTTWQLAGIVEEGDTTGGGVYTTPEGLAAATGQPAQVNRLRLVTDRHDEPTRDSIATTVDSTLAAAGIDVENASSVSRTDAASAGHMGPVLLVLLGIALPLGIVGGIGLASTMSANILDRTREFGIMHAVGAPPKAVRRIVTTEGVLLALTSCVVAILPTLALTAILGDGLGNLFGNAPLPYRISLLAVGLWTALAVLGAVLATEAAATRASRITVREALTYL